MSNENKVETDKVEIDKAEIDKVEIENVEISKYKLKDFFNNLFNKLPQKNEKEFSFKNRIILNNDELTVKDIFFNFFDMFNPNDHSAKTYISRVLNRDDTRNPWAILCYNKVKNSPQQTLAEVQRDVSIFLSSCKYDVLWLNDLLMKLIKKIITHSNLNDEKQKSLEEKIVIMKNDTAWLLAISLILIVLRDSDAKECVYPLISCEQGLSKKSLTESDKFYIEYLNSKNPEDLKKAVNSLTSKSRFDKEIRINNIKRLIDIAKKQVEHFKNDKLIPHELKELFKKHPNCGEAYYLKAIHCQAGLAQDEPKENATIYFCKAIETKDIDVIFSVLNEVLSNASYNSYAKELELMETTCKAIIDEMPSYLTSYAKARYVLGQLCEMTSRSKEAEEHFTASAKGGYAPATKKLKTKKQKRIYADSLSVPQNKEENQYHLLIDGDEKTVQQLIQKNADYAPETQWNVYSLNQSIKTVSQSSELDFLESQYVKRSEENFPKKCIFAYFSNNLEENLNNTLHLLDILYNTYLDNYESNETAKKRFIDSIDIYLSADYDTASPFIDANLSDMGDTVYFKVHICDKGKDSSRHLLTTCPLFIPFLKSTDGYSHVITFGNSNFIYNFIREATASCYMENQRVKISSLGKNINLIENKFRQNCEGIYLTSLHSVIKPRFFELDLTHPMLPSILSDNLQSNSDFDIKEIASDVCTGNYYVIDIGTDIENIIFARKLRGWLLRGDPKFKRLPFIAVRCKDKNTSYLAQKLTVGNKSSGDQWYNNYDLYCFDDSSSINPSYINLEQISLNIHLSYYKGNEESGKESYYKHSYNSDSSIATAVSLIYRMFDMGIYHKDYHTYSFSKTSDLIELAESYNKKVKSKNNEENTFLYAGEQSRWNCYMFTRGYLYASLEQVLSYMKERKSNSHKQELCKLHPYLCSWSDLSNNKESNFGILKQHIPELTDPKKSTKTLVKNILTFLNFNKDSLPRESE